MCAARVLLAGFVVFVCACRALPDFEANTCGNGVIDADESCDGFPIGEASCRPPSAAEPCHLDCNLRADGTRPACPEGWGCDVLGVCRAVTGSYRALSERVPGNAHTLLAGDFDGDKRDDVLSEQLGGPFGSTTFRVHYFDRTGKLDATWGSPATVASLAIADIQGDGHSDLVLSDARLGILLGQSDRTLISQTYPSYFLSGTEARVISPLYDSDVADTAPILILSERDGELSFSHPDSFSATLEVFASMPGTLADLAGEVAIGRVFEDPLRFPCSDVALALRDQSEVLIYSACTRSQARAQPGWLERAAVTHVSLEPAAPIERGPLLADVDGDGHIDVLIGAAGQIYVAFGDGQQLMAAKPLPLVTLDGAATPLDMPLAAGDINGDGAADFVYPMALVLSQGPGDRSGFDYTSHGVRLGTGWTVARVADLNDNGLLDVIAASRDRVDIDFYNGTGSDRLNPFVLQTKRPVDQLVIGDFDGDLISDVAFSQLGMGGEPDEVTIAFGSTSGAPATQQTTAHVDKLQQIGSLPYSGADVLGELFLLFEQAGAAGESGSAVAWFASAGDRNLRCLVELTSFAEDGSIQGVPGLVLTTGHFSDPERLDVALFGSNLEPDNHGFWLLSDLASGSARPESLGYPLDPRLVPLRFGSNPMAAPQVTLQLRAADVDGDHLDELVMVASDVTGTDCYLEIARFAGGSHEPSLQAAEPIALGQACAEPGQLALIDVDRDGASDVVLITLSGNDARTRELHVFWNDGHGGFSADASASFGANDGVEAFAPLRGAPVLTYVTEHAVHLLHSAADAPARELADTHLDLALDRATGVVGADVDGDGVQDLVIADNGSLRVLQAELRP